MTDSLFVFRLAAIVTLYIGGPFLIIWLYRRYKFFSKAGTIVMAYALGILMSLSGLTHPAAPEVAETLGSWQKILQTVCVPLAIPLMLFSSDFKAWTKNMKGTFVALFCGIVAVVAAVVLSFLFFKHADVNELDKAAGLMVGFYTGGTPNVASLNMALSPQPTTFLLVNTFEITLTFFLLAFFVGGGYKLIRKIMPFKKEDGNPNTPASIQGEEPSFENYEGMLSAKILKPLALPLLCSVVLFAVSGLFSMYLVPENFQEVAVILLITTLSIGLSFWKKLRSTPRMFELGMYFILVFSIIIASCFRIDQIERSTMGLMFFILSVLLLSVSFHFLLAKLCKVDADMFTISVVGLVFSPPFVPTVAGLMQSRRCLISGIMIGLMGYALGNYLGIAVYGLVQYL